MCGGGGLGGILGSIGGGLLDVAFPEFGVPLSLATGLGGLLGGTAGGLASGEGFGKALTGGLEEGAISGGLAGLGEVASGSSFFAAPGGSGISGLFGGAGSAADAASSAGTAATAAPSAGATLTAPVASTGTSLASAAPGAAGAGAGAGAPISGIGASTGAAPADITGALPTVGGGISGGAGTLPIGNLSGSQIAGAWNQLAANEAINPTPAAAGSFFSKLGSEWSPSAIGSDLLSPKTVLTAGAALPALLKSNSIPGLNALENQAALMSSTGGPLANALQTGQLPAGAQAALNASKEAAQAQVRSRFASMGLSGSSQEAQALAGVDVQAAGQQFQDLLQTTQAGLSEINAASPLYSTILSTQLAQDKATSDAWAKLASALAGGTA